MHNWTDVAIVVILVLSILISIMRGLIREVLSFITWVLAFYIAIRFSKPFAAVLSHYITSPSIQMVVAFILLFLGTLIVGSLISRLLGQLVDMTGLSGTDRILGSLFGIARGILLISVLLLIATFTSLPKETWWKQSELIPDFQPIEGWLQSLVPPSSQQAIQETIENEVASAKQTPPQQPQPIATAKPVTPTPTTPPTSASPKSTPVATPTPQTPSTPNTTKKPT